LTHLRLRIGCTSLTKVMGGWILWMEKVDGKGVRNEWHCHESNVLWGCDLSISQFFAQDGSWFLHQFIAVATTFENSRFQPARTICDFAHGNL